MKEEFRRVDQKDEKERNEAICNLVYGISTFSWWFKGGRATLLEILNQLSMVLIGDCDDIFLRVGVWSFW